MSSGSLAHDTAEPAAVRTPIAGARQGIAILAAWVFYSLFKIALIGAVQPKEKSSILISGAIVMSMGVFWALVTPPIFALARWLRARKLPRWRALGIHVVAAFVLAAALNLIRHMVIYKLAPDWSYGYLPELLGLLDYHLVTYAMLVVVADALDGHRAYAAMSRRAIALKVRLAEARLRFLQRQLQPHFLFNALNTIAELARESPAAARQMLGDLARLLRAAVAHADDPEVSLREELATLEPFVQIQRVRFSDSLDIRFNVAPAALDGCVPPMILQPLVENAVRHGRAANSRLQRVLISAQLEGTRLIIRVADSGAPGERREVCISREKNGRGIGLRNTVERLTQLYGTDYTFALRGERGRATVAELDIPFRTASHITAGAKADDVPRYSTQGILERGGTGPEFRAPITHDVAGLRAATAAPAPLAPEQSGQSAAPLTMRGWVWMLVFWVGCGLCWMSQDWVSYALSMEHPKPFMAARIEMVSAIVWMGITPVVLWLARAVPLHRGRVAPAVLIHAFAAAMLSALHVVIIYSIGVFDMPILTGPHVNVFTLNLYIYCALLAWTHARGFSAWYHARAISAAQTEVVIARSRVEATALGLHAPFLLRVFDFAADLAMVDAERTEHVVERLADLLRAMLVTGAEGARSVREELMLLRYCLAVHEALTGTPATLDDAVDFAFLDSYTPPGAVNAVMEYILVRAVAAPDRPMRVHARVNRAHAELVLAIEESNAAALPAYDGAYLTPRSA
jgi:two-component system LytT family sensor kinase